MFSRRSFLAGLLVSPVLGGASELCGVKTPQQPEGPFYPEDTKRASDVDLTRLNAQSPQALGQVIGVRGTVRDQNCRPVADAIVEIWQACASGKYDHSQDPNPAPLDPNFQYWGRAVTNAYGEYEFRTILPGAYPAGRDWTRPPHIHFKVSKLGHLELITQMYFRGQMFNDQDRILQRLSKEEQDAVVVALMNSPEHSYPVATFDLSLESVI